MRYSLYRRRRTWLVYDHQRGMTVFVGNTWDEAQEWCECH